MKFNHFKKFIISYRLSMFTAFRCLLNMNKLNGINWDFCTCSHRIQNFTDVRTSVIFPYFCYHRLVSNFPLIIKRSEPV